MQPGICQKIDVRADSGTSFMEWSFSSAFLPKQVIQEKASLQKTGDIEVAIQGNFDLW